MIVGGRESIKKSKEKRMDMWENARRGRVREDGRVEERKSVKVESCGGKLGMGMMRWDGDGARCAGLG